MLKNFALACTIAACNAINIKMLQEEKPNQLARMFWAPEAVGDSWLLEQVAKGDEFLDDKEFKADNASLGFSDEYIK